MIVVAKMGMKYMYLQILHNVLTLKAHSDWAFGDVLPPPPPITPRFLQI
jgi:hypothetical protein